MKYLRADAKRLAAASDPHHSGAPFMRPLGEPFGADQIVAFSSAQRMTGLEEALKALKQRRTAVEVFRLVERYAQADARIGAAGLSTALSKPAR
jgi:hypothetical protein